MSNQSKYRRIQPLILPPKAKKVVVDYKPTIEWLWCHQLFVNDDYQRSLSDKSHHLISEIARNFKWTSFHVPVVTPFDYHEEGYDFQAYEILDGQHTSIGSLTNGSIKQIPCLIVPTEDLIEKASSFVSLNTSNVKMTSLSVFWAEYTSKDEIAVEVFNGVSLGGGTIVRRPKPYGNFQVGEITAPVVLKEIAKRGGQIWVKRVVEAGVKSGLAPIGAHWLRAFELLLLRDGSGVKLTGNYDDLVTQIALTVRTFGADVLMRKALADKGRDSDSVFKELAYTIKKNLVT